MAVMIDGVRRPMVRSRLQQALHEAAPVAGYLAACIVAVAVPVLLRVLAFFPE